MGLHSAGQIYNIPHTKRTEGISIYKRFIFIRIYTKVGRRQEKKISQFGDYIGLLQLPDAI